MSVSVPENAEQTANELLTAYAAEYGRYAALADAMRVLLGQLCSAAGFVVEISARPKEHESLRRKLATKRYDSLGEIPDLAGVRIVASYTSDVDKICALLESEFTIVEKVQRAQQPDAFGYASRHLVVRLNDRRGTLTEWAALSGLRCEIQVRTILQHAWASISHALDYKSGEEVPGDVRRTLFQVAALIEVGDALFENFRRDVESLRTRYENISDVGDWRNLPVNNDALRAALRHLPIEEISDDLEKAGVDVLPDNPKFYSAIVQLAHRADIDSMGALESAITAGSTRAKWRKFLKVYVDKNSAYRMSVSFSLLIVLALHLNLSEISVTDSKFSTKLFDAMAKAQEAGS